MKDQPRFSKFQDKVVHFVLDDEDTARLQTNPAMWDMERYMEHRRWRKFVTWNEVRKEFGNDDVIGFGDADEIASRLNVHLFKHCEMVAGNVDVGIWFAFGHVEGKFRTDFPVPGHPYALGDPTYYQVGHALSTPVDGTAGRQRGTSGHYILGGIHMTYHGYLPYQYLRRLSITEANAQDLRSYALQMVRHQQMDIKQVWFSLVNHLEFITLTQKNCVTVITCKFSRFF